MRQYQGLNGFLLRTESEHDIYGAGHAGNRVVGWPRHGGGTRFVGGDETSSSWLGDAAFTCGISYEALNNVKAQTGRFIVVLNDNECRSRKRRSDRGLPKQYRDQSDLRAFARKSRPLHQGDRGEGSTSPRSQGRGRREEPPRSQCHFLKNSDCVTTGRLMDMIFRSSLGLSSS